MLVDWSPNIFMAPLSIPYFSSSVAYHSAPRGDPSTQCGPTNPINPGGLLPLLNIWPSTNSSQMRRNLTICHFFLILVRALINFGCLTIGSTTRFCGGTSQINWIKVRTQCETKQTIEPGKEDIPLTSGANFSCFRSAFRGFPGAIYQPEEDVRLLRLSFAFNKTYPISIPVQKHTPHGRFDVLLASTCHRGGVKASGAFLSFLIFYIWWLCRRGWRLSFWHFFFVSAATPDFGIEGAILLVKSLSSSWIGNKASCSAQSDITYIRWNFRFSCPPLHRGTRFCHVNVCSMIEFRGNFSGMLELIPATCINHDFRL